MQEEERERLQGKLLEKFILLSVRKELKEFNMGAHKGDFVYFRDIYKFSYKMILL